jgi:hypothetical protein
LRFKNRDVQAFKFAIFKPASKFYTQTPATQKKISKPFYSILGGTTKINKINTVAFADQNAAGTERSDMFGDDEKGIPFKKTRKKMIQCSSEK